MILVVLLFFLCAAAFGQERGNAPDSGDAFTRARDMIFNHEREAGRIILTEILLADPDFDEARILLARSLAWDAQRSAARKELQVVLGHQPDHADALSALYDVEIWDDRYKDALHVADAALNHYPGSADFLFKKASVLVKLNRTTDALSVLDSIPADHVAGKSLREQIVTSNMKYTAGVSFGIDVFSRTFQPAMYTSLQLARANSWGTAIARINHSSRFSSGGIQAEVDLYPRIVRGVYAYVNYGYSSSDLFSRHRIGGELYAGLPHRLEASGGVRYLSFGHGSDVLIYTGSIGWYVKNFWLSYRPYITPGQDATSFSSTFIARRYFADADSYIGLSGNVGFSPDERRIQSGSGLSDDGIYVLRSQNAGLAWQRKFSGRWIVNLSYTIVHQELSFDVGRYVWINSSFLSVKRKF